MKKGLVYAIAKNITHKKRHEVGRNQKIAELTKVSQRLKQLNYTTSHDLRTPVGNLISIFGMMDTSHINDLETLELIQWLKTASENLKTTLDKYVDDFSQCQTLQVEVQELQPPGHLERSPDFAPIAYPNSKTQFHVDFEAYQTVTFNAAYMESILLNLISNSIKYAHPDRNPVITMQTVIEDDVKRLIFADNGIGFDSDKLKNRIFGLHETFHDHADSKGIGLYLVYQQVTSLGGRISVESVVNQGTTFTITFRNHPIGYYEI